MLFNRVSPLAEPLHERLNQSLALLGMATDYLPLRFRGVAGFVQNIDVHGQLPYVVQKRRPPQPIAVSLR
jgi:hypothetical protein